jgi:hypothetical protein
MSKFQKMLQISNDISLLEKKGKFEAAFILHNKFVKEAQVNPPRYKPTTQDDTPKGKEVPEPHDEFQGVREYSELLNDLQYNADNSNFDKYYQEYINNLDSYPEDEKRYLKTGVDRILKQRRKDGLVDPKVVQPTRYSPGTVDDVKTDFQSKEWKMYNPPGYVIDSPVGDFAEGLAKFEPKSDVNLNLKNNTFQENAKEFDSEMARIITNYQSSSPAENDFNLAESILNLMQAQKENMPDVEKASAEKTLEEYKKWISDVKSRNPVSTTTNIPASDGQNSNKKVIDKLEDRVFDYKRRIQKFRNNKPKLKKLKEYIKKEWDDERLDDNSYYDLIKFIDKYDK